MKVGSLEIDFLINLAKLKQQMDSAQRTVSTSTTAIGRSIDSVVSKFRGWNGGMDAVGKTSNKARSDLANLSFQLNDVAVGLASGQKPMTVFIQQGAQILQIAQMAEGGFKGFAKQVGGLALRFTPLAAVAAVAGVAMYRWQQQLNDDAGLKKYAEGLGLTQKEMKKLKDVSVDTGDIVAGLWKTIADGTGIGNGKGIVDRLFPASDLKQIETFVAQIYGVFVGGYTAIVAIWTPFASAIGAFFSRAAVAAATALAPLVDFARSVATGIAGFFEAVWQKIAGWMGALGRAIAPILQAVGIDRAAAAVTTMGTSLGHTFGQAYTKATTQAVASMDGFFARAGANAIDHARAAVKKKADEIIADRTPKTDHHAEQLAREAAAIEAQIKNLYLLAEAYKVSGAAALIAEAREKAESSAIRNRGDIEAAVDRQVRLAVAQRVADGVKAAAALGDQAKAQESVNSQVAAGIVPAARAGDVLRNMLALLPLLAAQQAARMRGDVKGAEAATAAMTALAAAQERDTAARRDAQALQDHAAAENQIAQLEVELKLIGATDAARVHALATIRATQEATAKNYTGDQAAAYIADQVRIADMSERNRIANDNYNLSLSYSAELLDAIDQKAQSAAQGLAHAFGQAGQAIGDLVTAMTGYAAKQQQLADEKRDLVKRAGGDAEQLARIEALYAVKSAGAQVAHYGDIAAAAQGFFKQGSDGYKALQKAEQVFRAIEFAMSLRSIVQSGVETAAKVANHLVGATAAGTEAVATAAATTPFPFSLGAMAAMAAALATIGVLVGGSFGGGKNNLPKANDGTGTVLGDASAKSDSIKNAIELLGDVDTATMHYSAQMAASLKSIESQIGGLAALLVRTGDISGATAGIQTGFKSSVPDILLGGPTGALLKKIPIIGDIFGAITGVIKSLFGTKTSVLASGLYGSAQSLGSVLDGGFNLQTYADLQKKKKFLGITTGTSYSTQYGAADGDVAAQFGLILKSFYDAIGAAAVPLGRSTADVEHQLDSFVVNLGKIDFTGLSGDEIQKKLEAVFGAAADQMAAAAFPGIEKFQAVGEGAFQTLTRVASTVEAVTSGLQTLGLTTQGLGVDASMSLAGLFKSVDDMNSATSAYFTTFYTAEEQAEVKTKQLTDAFGSLGLTLPDSIANYRALVEAQDLTTAAGQQTYAALIQLAPAFAGLNTAMQDATSAAAIVRERQDLETKLLQLQGDTNAIRAAELDKINPANRALQQRINALTDEQAATEAATQAAQAAAQAQAAIASERAGLERQLLELTGDTAAIRALDLANIDASNQALQLNIWALQDQAAVTQAATQAAEAAAQREAQIASERAGLMQQIWQLTGDTGALRAAELANLDPANQALQQRIYALQDEQAAQQAAEQAAQAAAQAADQLRQAWASLASGILDEVKRIRGLTASPAVSYASLLGQFNAATAQTRAGDQDAGKYLPELSRALLDAAADNASSSLDLQRIQAMTAASLEQTYALITGTAVPPMAANEDPQAQPWWGSLASGGSSGTGDSGLTQNAAEVADLRAEVSGLRQDLRSALAAIAGNTRDSADVLKRVSGATGGDAFATEAA